MESLWSCLKLLWMCLLELGFDRSANLQSPDFFLCDTVQVPSGADDMQLI